MDDLYSILGVARDTDIRTIRRAFRRRVRSTHPDGGGSVEAFNELKAAYDILSDPIRRRRYDEVGDVGDPARDPRRAKLIEILSFGLDQALLRLSKTPYIHADSNLIKLTMNVLVEKRLEFKTHKSNFERALQATRLLEGRFHVAAGENLMDSVIAKRISACQTQIDLLADQVKLVDEAVVILRDTRFDSLVELVSTKEGIYPYLDSAILARFS
jgi:curved DNA-binding protein CbpA